MLPYVTPKVSSVDTSHVYADTLLYSDTSLSGGSRNNK